MPVQTVIKLRRDTAANWETAQTTAGATPILAAGEQGYETDTGLIKIGDGTTLWGALPYQAVSRIVQPVKNTTGSSIPKGSVVYISGATGGDALISLADADTEATSSKTIGLTAETIANDAFGDVVCEGLLSGVNTSAATAGQAVWLSSTAGGFVFNNPPAKPAHSVYLGIVTRVHATEGEILVKVQNGYELNELHDVNITGTVADNEVLAWDDASQIWINQTAAEAGLATSSHNHTLDSLSNVTITSNVAGELLKWDGAKWINNTLAEAGVEPTVTLTASRAVVSDASGKLAASTVPTTALQYLASATGTTGTTSSNVVFSASPTFTGTVTGAPAEPDTLANTAKNLGYVGLPQTILASGNLTLTKTHAGEHIYVTGASQTITIPANSAAAFEIGTTIVIINANVTSTVAITTDTLRLAGTATTGSRTIAAYGMATLVKVAATTWMISGNGVS